MGPFNYKGALHVVLHWHGTVALTNIPPIMLSVSLCIRYRTKEQNYIDSLKEVIIECFFFACTFLFVIT